jgi:hypothetical protein
MFKISLLALFAVAAFAQTADEVATASEKAVMGGSAGVGSGGRFVFRSVLRPAGGTTAGLGGGGIWSSGNTVHRYMIDESSKSCFGYDVVVGTPDASGSYSVTFAPLSQCERSWESENLKLVVLPKYPAPKLMHDGERIELDLMASPDGSRKLTDIIAIRMHDTGPPAPTTTAAPRDYTIDDGPITFDCGGCTFWKGGRKVEGTGFGSKPGATLWVAIPGHGRYILSLIPHDGFVKAGAVRDNVVQFENYEVRFQSPVAGTGKAWNLYVQHDAGYSVHLMVQMGTDRLENLLAKH